MDDDFVRGNVFVVETLQSNISTILRNTINAIINAAIRTDPDDSAFRFVTCDFGF